MPLKKKLKAVNDENQEEKSNQEKEALSSDEDIDSNDSSSGSGSEEDDLAQDEMMVDFEARELEESDLNTINILIQQKLSLFPSLSSFEISKYLIEQKNIGNVIFQSTDNDDDDEGPVISNTNASSNNNQEDDYNSIFGVLSIIDLKSSKCKNIAENLKNFLINECQQFDKLQKPDKSLEDKLKDVLTNKNVSFVVNERFINIPPAISVPMFESLLKDLDKSVEKLNYDYWLFMAKVFKDDSKSSTKKKASKVANSEQSQTIYANPEEEIFEEFSDLKFEISYGNKASKSTAGKWSADDPSLLPILKAFLVPKEKINEALNKIKSLV